jgi:myosin heavy subunit
LGQITEIEGNKVKVKYGQGEVRECETSQILQASDPKKFPNGFDDMVDMEILNEAEVLNNVRLRYESGRIFTYVGSTLLVVNPFQTIDAQFTMELFKKFQTCTRDLNIDFREHPPHSWAIAANTMIELRKKLKSPTPRNQAIIISGESGSGKTENTKYCMKFLTSVGNMSVTEDLDSKIEERVYLVDNRNWNRFWHAVLSSKHLVMPLLSSTITQADLESTSHLSWIRIH